MNSIGIYYGSSTGTTEKAAEAIRDAIGNGKTVVKNIGDTEVSDLQKHDLLILGSSTWGIGDLQDDWEGNISLLDSIDLSGKKVALFGCGDQEAYSDSFVDAIGILYHKVVSAGAEIVGKWPVDGYSFDDSKGVVAGEFAGLVLDDDNQVELTEDRIMKWVKTLNIQE